MRTIPSRRSGRSLTAAQKRAHYQATFPTAAYTRYGELGVRRYLYGLTNNELDELRRLTGQLLTWWQGCPAELCRQPLVQKQVRLFRTVLRELSALKPNGKPRSRHKKGSR